MEKATEPSEMVKRLALIFANHAFSPSGEPPTDAGFTWGEFSAREKTLATAAARAAIEAMMEPPETVMRAAFDSGVATEDWLDFLRCHRRVIEECLRSSLKGEGE